MRQKGQNGHVSLQAIAGTHVVLLGVNLPKEECPDMEGFAIRRHDHSA